MSPTSSAFDPLKSAAQQGLGWQPVLVIHLPAHWLSVDSVQRESPEAQHEPVKTLQLAG